MKPRWHVSADASSQTDEEYQIPLYETLARFAARFFKLFFAACSWACMVLDKSFSSLCNSDRLFVNVLQVLDETKSLIRLALLS